MIAHLCITKWCTEANRILQYSQERAWKTWASRGWWSCNKVIIHLYMYMYVGWWWLLWGRGCLQCSVAMPAMARTLPAAWCLANPWPRPDVPSVSRTPRVDVACAFEPERRPGGKCLACLGLHQRLVVLEAAKEELSNLAALQREELQYLNNRWGLRWSETWDF